MLIHLKPKERILFLQEFTKTLLQTIAKKEWKIEEDKNKESVIKMEKLRKKLLPGKSILEKKEEKEFEASKIPPSHEFFPPISQTSKLSLSIPSLPTPPSPIAPIKKPISKPLSSPPKLSQQLPQPKKPKAPAIERVKLLFRDPTVKSVECPGPGKNLLVRRYNKIYVTKINLEEDEIKNIIEYFADKAKIPIVGGMLKAAVDDFVISAVTSEVIGSRFIIKKIGSM